MFSEPQLPKFSHSLTMVAWGLNEEELLEEFLDRAFRTLDAVASEYEIVFVDDGSTDRTPQILAAYAAREPRLRVVTNPVNLNTGLSQRRAVEMVRTDYFFWQVVDWAYDITHLRTYLSFLEDFDVVQGVRPTPERIFSHIPVIRSIYRVRGRSDNLWKALVSLTNYYVLRILYNTPFHDFQNVTFYPTRLARQMELRGTTPFANPEMLIKAYYLGARILEVPIPFIKRSKGQGKGTRIPTILRTIADILGNWFRWGWRLRFLHQDRRGSIHRVAEPFNLPEGVLYRAVPLFKYFT